MLRNFEIMDTFLHSLYLTSGIYGVRNILKYCRKNMKHWDNSNINAH